MSTHADLHDLIQADLDGRASPSDRARLNELLAGDAEAREEHRRLRSLRDLLATIPPEVPPANLGTRIIRALRAERSKTAGSRWPLLSFWPGGRVVIPYAYAAAAGAAIAVVGLHFFPGGGPFVPDAVEREAAATIGSAPVGTESGRLVLSGGNVQGSATLRTLDDGLALDVELPAHGDLSVHLGFDPASVKFVGIANRTGGIDHIQIADGTVSWSQSQPQKVTVFVVPRSPAGSRVDVRFTEAGGATGGGSLDLPGRN
jgi:hypothetical protein